MTSKKDECRTSMTSTSMQPSNAMQFNLKSDDCFIQLLKYNWPVLEQLGALKIIYSFQASKEANKMKLNWGDKMSSCVLLGMW
jgi:hypothetical protein